MASVTEDVAKTRWCPFTRVIAGTLDGKGGMDCKPHQAPWNRIQTGGENFNLPTGTQCVGSLCMAWKWISDGADPSTKHGDCRLMTR
jgi:hypothetical protein